MRFYACAGNGNLIALSSRVVGYGNVSVIGYFNSDIVTLACANPIGAVCYLDGNGLVERTNTFIHFRVCSVFLCGHCIGIGHRVAPGSAQEISVVAYNIECCAGGLAVIFSSSNADSGDGNRCYNEH